MYAPGAGATGPDIPILAASAYDTAPFEKNTDWYFGKPDVWLSSCRTVTPGASGSDGATPRWSSRISPTGWSSDSSPRSTICMITIAVSVFEMLAMRKRSVTSVGSQLPATRTPYAAWCTSSPSTSTATEALTSAGIRRCEMTLSNTSQPDWFGTITPASSTITIALGSTATDTAPGATAAEAGSSPSGVGADDGGAAGGSLTGTAGSVISTCGSVERTIVIGSATVVGGAVVATVVSAGMPRVNAGSGGGAANRAWPHPASIRAPTIPAHAPAARERTSQPRRLTPHIMADHRRNCTLRIRRTTNRNNSAQRHRQRALADNCCSVVSTGSNRSPIAATRSSTSSLVNRSSSSPEAHASTSSHATGVDTVGSSRARREYGAIVVLWWAF